MVRRMMIVVMIVIPSAALRAAPPTPAGLAPGGPVALPATGSVLALSAALRPALIQAIPKPLYEASPGWGNTRDAFHKMEWKKGKVLPHAQVVKSPHNHGVWRKIRVTAQNLDKTLAFDMRNFKPADKEHITFTVYLAFDTDIEFDQQNWEKGLRLYAGSIRARARVHATLDCDALMRLETGKSMLPEAVLRLRVLKADLGYNNLVVEHIAGVGGATAKVVGDAFHHTLTTWRPSVEKNMLERANAAIVRAGDTREIRISVADMLKAFEKK